MADTVNGNDDKNFNTLDSTNPEYIAEQIYQLWLRWSNFEMYIINPIIDVIIPPMVIKPEKIEAQEYEFVYDIYDHGHKLVTSKAQDMYSGRSMCRLFYTIEKMIYLLIERLKSMGTESDEEVQIAFGGHEIAQRKAFESIINLAYNVVVINFDPGIWGEKYLENIKIIAQKGLGYPPESPRSNFRQLPGNKQTSSLTKLK